ncbi:MAG: sulfotransferase, partial [Fimbriimonadaceae bacterium]|nr:sulfotransferase [Alphaproteobacteria bacterium]
LSICDALLSKYPKYVGALHTAGLTYADKRDHPNALNHLVRAVMYCPENWRVATALAAAYLEMAAPEMAATTLDHAASLAPDDLSIMALRAMVFHEQRDYVGAAELFSRVLARDASFSGAAIGHALASIEMGKYEDAATSLKALVERGERSIRVIQLLTRVPSHVHGLDLQRLAHDAKPTGSYKRGEFETTLGFIRASLAVTGNKVEEAWSALMAANKLAAAGTETQRRQIGARQSEALNRLKTSRLRPKPLNPDPSLPVSLFILGSSRSGKTTLESLIGTLPNVQMGYENPIAFKAAQQVLRLSGFPDSGYAGLPRELEGPCRDVYSANLRKRAGDAMVFTNTDPNLIHDVLSIASVLPNARFVFVKRNIYDTVFGILMTLYRFGNEYSYDLKSVWEHVLWYHSMIDLLSERMPETSFVTTYEETVLNPAEAITNIANLCRMDVIKNKVSQLDNDVGVAGAYRSYIDTALGK